jgi:predicted HTH transcriptional regulator
MDYVRHGREERNLEFKERLDWSKSEGRNNLIKAALAMSNIRDGGVIVLGVRNDGTPVGLSAKEAVVFDHDALAPVINEYAEPYTRLVVTSGHDPDDGGRWFVVIQIQEFHEYPVICKRDGTDLRRGALYTRSTKMNASAEVASVAEMKEILDLAVEKGIRAFNLRAASAGIPLPSTPTAREQYERQLGKL